jgi:pimeloyl-ACP methyl ester carboxylesterase
LHIGLSPRRALSLALIFGSARIASAEDSRLFSTECLGSKNDLQLIYLHGIFQGNETHPPIEFRDDLRRLANELPIRIAVPRSHLLCKRSKDRYCWGDDQPKTIEEVYSKLLKSVASCFDVKKGFGIIGFSNGGYHATRAALRCLQPQPKFVLAVGSSGDSRLAVSPDLSSCAEVHLLIGIKDMTRDGARGFSEAAAKSKLRVSYATFNGGHTLPMPEVRRFLRDRLGK